MGDIYASVVVSGYNANPPADDGSAVASNQILWATIKSKLPDPLKTAIEAVNANADAAFAKLIGGIGPLSTGVSYAVLAADQGKPIRATASGITITFPDATSVGSPFMFPVLNSSSGNITLAGAGGQTINGSASLVMAAGDGYTAFTDGSNWFVLGRKTGVLPRGYIDGCILANGADATNDITIAAGVVRDSTNTVDITVAAMTTGKQLDANWAPGDAAGMRNSAAGIANGTYHLYAVAKADGTQDIYAHASATVATVLTALQAETGGASYVYAALIGSILRESAAIVGFIQHGDYFQRKSVVNDISANNPNTSAVTRTLSVPVGINVIADVIFGVVNTASSVNVAQAVLSDLATTDTAPTTGYSQLPQTSTQSGANGANYCELGIRTNTSAQIRSRLSNSDANTTLYITTRGWWQQRGKNA